MEVWAIFVSHDLKAARDRSNGWRLGIFVLTQTRNAGLAAGRAPQTFVPFVHHRIKMHSARRPFQPKMGATPKIESQYRVLAETGLSQMQNRPANGATLNVACRTDGGRD